MSVNTQNFVLQESQLQLDRSVSAGPAEVSPDLVARFDSIMTPKEQAGGGITEAISKIEQKFNKQHSEVVKSIKDFEHTGSAVELMVASHQGANRSVMVQLVGTVGKKSADNAEQIYKQQ